MSRAADIRKALAEHAEVRSWHCESCGNMIEDGYTGPYCRGCADYWKDAVHWAFVDGAAYSLPTTQSATTGAQHGTAEKERSRSLDKRWFGIGG